MVSSRQPYLSPQLVCQAISWPCCLYTCAHVRAVIHLSVPLCVCLLILSTSVCYNRAVSQLPRLTVQKLGHRHEACRQALQGPSPLTAAKKSTPNAASCNIAALAVNPSTFAASAAWDPLLQLRPEPFAPQAAMGVYPTRTQPSQLGSCTLHHALLQLLGSLCRCFNLKLRQCAQVHRIRPVSDAQLPTSPALGAPAAQCALISLPEKH